MIFLKKCIILFLVFSLIILSGCVQKDLVDIYLFSERFTRYSENFKIDTKNLVAEEKGEELAFPLTFGDKFLLSVRVNDGTSLVTSFSVTYVLEKGREMSKEDFLSFLEIAESSVRAFTKLEKTDEIFSELSITEKENVLKDNHLSFTKGFYEYSFVSDEIGLYFTASTERRK